MHGERDKMGQLAAKLSQDMGIEVHVPGNGDRLKLDVHPRVDCYGRRIVGFLFLAPRGKVCDKEKMYESRADSLILYGNHAHFL